MTSPPNPSIPVTTHLNRDLREVLRLRAAERGLSSSAYVKRMIQADLDGGPWIAYAHLHTPASCPMAEAMGIVRLHLSVRAYGMGEAVYTHMDDNAGFDTDGDMDAQARHRAATLLIREGYSPLPVEPSEFGGWQRHCLITALSWSIQVRPLGVLAE